MFSSSPQLRTRKLRAGKANFSTAPENKIEDTPEGAVANPMSDEMTKLTIWTGLLGLLIGLVISAYAHSGNGFESGPLVLLGLTISGLGAIGSVLLIFVMGKRSHLVSGMGTFFAAMLIALVVVPMVWPYPKSPGPAPVNGSLPSVKPK